MTAADTAAHAHAAAEAIKPTAKAVEASIAFRINASLPHVLAGA
jgi:hypothetical protein